MAIFIPGMICQMCGNRIENVTEAELFPPFIGNREDPLAVFHDAVMHISCFGNHPDRIKVTDLLSQREKKLNAKDRVCELCNHEITEPDDYVGHPCLSSKNDELSKYNFMQYHKKCYEGSSIERIIVELSKQR